MPSSSNGKSRPMMASIGVSSPSSLLSDSDASGCTMMFDGDERVCVLCRRIGGCGGLECGEVGNEWIALVDAWFRLVVGGTTIFHYCLLYDYPNKK